MCPDRKRKWYQRLSLNPSSARARMRTKLAGRGEETGLSLVEVMVAFTVLMIALVPLAYLLNSTAGSAAQNRQREAAVQLANSWLQILANTTPPVRDDGVQDGVEQRVVYTGVALDPTGSTPNPADLASGWPASGIITPSSLMPGASSNPSTSDCPATYDSSESAMCPQSLYYLVQATFNFAPLNSAGQSDLCAAGQPFSKSNPAVVVLQVTVYWDNKGQSTSATTNVPYPSPNVQTEGFLAIQLQNDLLADINGHSASDRYQVVPITITSDDFSTTVEADENGCAFVQVPQGTYDVSIGQPSPGVLAGYTGAPPYVEQGTGNQTIDRPGVIVAEAEVTNVNATAFDQAIDASLSYPSATDLARGVRCPGTASMPCVAIGSDSSGLSASTGGGGGTWSVGGVPDMTTLSQVACTPASTPVCVAVGSNGANGAIDTTTSGLSSATPDTVPAGVTNISQVSCPSNQGCYAIGVAGSTPVLLAGAVGQTAPQADTWSIVTVPGTTFSSLTALACPTSSTCELAGVATTTTNPNPTTSILRLDGDPGELATNSGWTPTFTSDSVPGVTTSIGSLTCPSSTCEALAAVNATGTPAPVVLTTAVASSGACPSSPSACPSSTWSAEPLPAGPTSLSSISCTASACLVAGTEGGAPGLWGADLTASPHSWTDETANLLSITGASSFAAVTGVACGEPTSGDTADCAVTATAATGTTAVLADGYLANGSWSWNLPSTPSVDIVDAYLGVSCEPNPSSTRADCAAVGVADGSPVILDTSSGPGGTWRDHTPAYSGSVAQGIPLELTAQSPTAWSTVQEGGSSNKATLTDLYPETGGYLLAAGDCQAASSVSTPSSETPFSATTPLLKAPGGTADVHVPLGLLSIDVQRSGATPISNATVTLTPTSCPSDTFHYAMPATDANGWTALSVPYGTYSYTVNGTTPSTNGVITVVPTEVLVGTTPYYLSSPAVVQSS